MKKSSLLVLLMGCNTALSAQFFIEPYAGYMFSTHPVTMNSYEIIDDNKTVYTSKLRNGQGVNAGLVGGYYLGNWSIEINGCTHVHSTVSNSSKLSDRSTIQNNETYYHYGYVGEMESQNKIYQVSPQLGFNIKDNKFSVSLKVGPNFLKTRIIDTRHYIDWELVEETAVMNPCEKYFEIEKNSNFNIGLRASVCADYQITPNIFVCVDLVSVYNHSKITDGEIRRYDIDGVSQIDRNPDTEYIYDPGDERINFSQVGIDLGIKYVFLKHE